MSESRYAPAELIRRLADESVDIGAPLLIRSPVLTDVDLIAFIGRHGAPHARAIRRRPALNPAIVRLVDMLLVSTPKATAATTREQLREIMRSDARSEAAPAEPAPTECVAADASGKAYARMLATVFHPNPALFQTALADALDIAFDRAGQIVSAPHYSELMLALRALEFSEEQAFLICAAAYSQAVGDRNAVSLFLGRYRQSSIELAAGRLDAWRNEKAIADRPEDLTEAPEFRRLRAS